MEDRNQILVFTFLDIATSVVSVEKRNRWPYREYAQFFYLGAIDFLRQAESLDNEEFYSLIEQVFSRYEISLEIPVSEYLDRIADEAPKIKSLENAMVIGANSFKRYWSEKDPHAPLDFAKLIAIVDDVNDKS